MGAEAQNQPENQKNDPVVEAAEKDLKEIRKEEGDTKSQLDGKIRRLNSSLESLQAKYDEANFLHDDKNAVKYLDDIQKLTASIDALEEAKKTASDEADAKREKVADRLDAKSEKGEERAKTKQELEEDIQTQTAIIDSSDPKVSVDQKKAAHEKRGEDQDALKKLEAKEKRDHAMEASARYKTEEAKSRAEEQVQLAHLEAQIDGREEPSDKKAEAAPETPKDAGKDKTADQPNDASAQTTPEKGLGFGDRVDKFVHSMLVDIAGKPPQTAWEKFTTSSKAMMIRISLALGSDGNHSWAEEFNDAQKLILEKVIGMKISPDGQSSEPPIVNKYKLEWVEPDPKFRGPDKTTQDVFAKYFTQDNWLATFQHLGTLGKNGKPTVKEVEASFSSPPTPENIQLKALIDDLAVTNKDSDFFDAVSKKGYKLLDHSAPASSPEAPTARIPILADALNPLSDANLEATDKIFGETAISVVKERGFNTQTKAIDVMSAILPKFMDAFLHSPEGIQALQSSFAKIPLDTLKDMVARDTTFTETERTQLSTDLNSNGKFSPESLSLIADRSSRLISTGMDRMKTYVDHFASSAASDSNAALLQGSIGELLKKDMAASTGPNDVDRQLLTALEANDPKVQTPPSPTAS